MSNSSAGGAAVTHPCDRSAASITNNAGHTAESTGAWGRKVLRLHGGAHKLHYSHAPMGNWATNRRNCLSFLTHICEPTIICLKIRVKYVHWHGMTFPAAAERNLTKGLVSRAFGFGNCFLLLVVFCFVLRKCVVCALGCPETRNPTAPASKPEIIGIRYYARWDC